MIDSKGKRTMMSFLEGVATTFLREMTAMMRPMAGMEMMKSTETAGMIYWLVGREMIFF